MEAAVLDTLEYGAIRARLGAHCATDAARAAALAVEPAATPAAARTMLEETREAYLIAYEYAARPVILFDDVDQALERLRLGSTLDIPALLRVARLLRAADRLQDAILAFDDERIELLPRLAANITHADEIQRTLFRSIADEETLADEASPKLAAAREEIRLSQNRIKDKLAGYLRSSRYAGVLRERLVTVRDNRYVLPVRSEYKSAVPGLVHDVSDSGATVFIEPMPVVELNNRLREAMAAEQEETARVLSELSRLIAANLDVVINNRTYCTRFDLIFARAAYAESTGAVMPELTECRTLTIEAGRHPLLDPVSVVANTISIPAHKRVLLISGPNTGGKTVVLKTVGLFCLMAYSGLFLPCRRAEMSFYDAIYCDIGDRQSIADNLSTFSAHIQNLVRITSAADESSLALLDELGSGTDPEEGAALAVAIVDRLASQGVTAVVTTHYSELKEYGLLAERVENASMEFDAATLRPTYRLRAGLPGVSNALNIAEMMGLNAEILTYARAYLGEGKRTFEEVLRLADEARIAADAERRRLTAEREALAADIEALRRERERVAEQYEKLTRQAKAEVDKIVERSVGTAEEIVAEMNRLLKEVNETNLLKAKQLRTRLGKLEGGVEREADWEDVDPAALKIGDTVVVKSLGASAQVKTLPDRQGKLDVSVGSLAVRVAARDLARQRFAPKPRELKTEPPRHAASPAGGAALTEINLLGKTVGEALPDVDAFLDQAAMHGIEQVKIIHGVGTGALRKGIVAHLKRHPGVREFRQGAYGEGGYGVTIVALK